MTKAKPKPAPAAKAAAPKKKGAAAEVVTLPAPVKEEEKAPETVVAPLPAPDKLSALGPNEKFPYGIKITQGTKVAYERFKTQEIRDVRLASLGKREEVEAVDYTASGSPPPPAEAPKKPSLVKSKEEKPKVSNINKRITEGAEVKEWRWARSLRVGKPGFFAQGGHYKRTNRGNEFIVGEEYYFKTLTEAQKFVMSKAPASE